MPTLETNLLPCPSHWPCPHIKKETNGRWQHAKSLAYVSDDWQCCPVCKTNRPGVEFKSSPFDDYNEVAEKLLKLGWDCRNDAQFSHIKAWCEELKQQWNIRTTPSQPSFDRIEQRQQAMEDSTKLSSDDMKLMVGSAQPPYHPFAKAASEEIMLAAGLTSGGAGQIIIEQIITRHAAKYFNK